MFNWGYEAKFGHILLDNLDTFHWLEISHLYSETNESIKVTHIN